YFKNKDDLLTSIFDWAMGEFINRAKSELAELEDPRERLPRFAHLHFLLLEQERDIAIVFQIELRQSTKFMKQLSTNNLGQFLQMLREIREGGRRRDIFRNQSQSKVVAKFLFGVLDELATNWVLSRKNYSLAAMVEPVLDIFLNGVSNV